MARDFDVSQELQSDVNTVKRINRKGVGGLSPGAVIEYVLWFCSILSVIAMMVALPWVGEGDLIPGTAWLGYSLAAILFFGVFAGLMRWVRETGEEIDRGVSRRMESDRGR